MSYYNTNKEKSQTLLESEKKAISQEERMLATFKVASRKLTANDVHQIWSEEDQARSKMPPLLTSIRRAMSNLVENKCLIKTNKLKCGPYGKNVHYYQLANAPELNQLDLFKNGNTH